jgi:5-formyltetrahydrofolate cyclo-ligase
MSSIKKQKNELREKVFDLRQQIPEDEWAKKTRSITGKLLQTDVYSHAKTIHTYISMNQRMEVGTDELIEKIFESEKNVVVPVTNFSNTSLKHIRLHSFEELIVNKWGIREPEEVEETVNPNELDLIIIPMAAADRDGNRLGYGKGFYDRFLSDTDAKKVGLVFNQFLYDDIPVEEFDQKLDMIITEEVVIFT